MYVAKTPQETEEVVLNIKKLATAVPAATYFIVAIILFFVYLMTKEALAEIQAELERRRTGK